MNDAALQVNNLSKVYQGAISLEVISGLNFEVEKGEIFAIVGESGSGKTTLLNLIGGIDSVTSGEIIIVGKAIQRMNEAKLATFRNHNIGYIFQFYNLLPEFNAIENVMIPYLIGRYNKKEAYARAKRLLDIVGLSKRIDHKIGELSGGEQQRIAIARALINEPSIILADEPTGNLDEKNAELIREALWSVTRELNQTLIVVTHSMAVAAKANRIMRLHGGTGIIESTEQSK